MKYLILLAMLTVYTVVNGQSIVGKWITYDDETKIKKGLVEIYRKDKKYYAKIVYNYNGDQDAICYACKGSKKNMPVIGLVIIENLKRSGGVYEGGRILDPDTGEYYSCYLELVKPNRLKVRGYMGISLFGRTQYWVRKK